MPIYEYRRPDGSTFEVMQSFSDPPLQKDPETGVKVQRVLHAPAVHFKGKGFYNTDYGTRKRQRETAAAGDGGSAKGEGGKDGGSGGSSGSGSGSGSGDGGSSASSDGKAKGEKSGKDASKTRPVAAGK